MIVLRTLGFLLAAFAVLSHSSVLLAQSTWRQRLSQQGAPPRTFMAICYDSARRETVVFGGMFPGGGGGGGGTPLNETWSWDGILWRQQHPGGSPSARFGSAMAFDAVRQEAVLFGGLDQTNIPMGDTWIWDGSTWTQRNPVSSPPPMLAHAMVYDAARDEVVLFGGVGGPTPHNMTWVWDGSTWTRRFPANSPPLRCFHAMVYDTARQETVLFGGSAQTQDPGLPLGDTWCWNGTDWSQRFPGNAPSARFFHQMAFYGPDSSVLLHGGSGNAGPMSDTWLWNGSTWTKPPSYVSPGPRMMGGMAYDSARSEAVLYSGTGQGGPVFDTWVYQACHNIVRQPGSQTVLSGLSATLSVRDDALGPVAYQWYEGSSGDASHPIEGATTDTYTTPPLTSDTNYWVRLENVCSSIDSATAVISVTSFCVPPSISPQPDDQVIQPGASATLWITANGSSPLTYQWYTGLTGDTTNQIVGATAASYTTPPLVATSDYWVQVTNACGTTNSNTGTVTVAGAGGPWIQSIRGRGAPGDKAVIRGTGFSLQPRRNEVFFGGYRAFVRKAGETKLTVIIPKKLDEGDSVPVYARVDGVWSNTVEFEIK